VKSEKIVIAVFSGTGNTLLMAETLAEELRSGGKNVALAPMERPDFFDSAVFSGGKSDDTALGLAVPVACFSTYPTAWRFIDSLPPSDGREIFFLATMGGMGAGMEGPIRGAVARKGYRPTGALLVAMPGNYGNKTLDLDGNKKREAKALDGVKKYARALLDGTANWGGGVPFVSKFTASLAHGRKPWDFFHRMFPISVDHEKCTGCELCVKICPEKNIDMLPGKASIQNRCQSCQRCIAFCPADAIRVPGKPSLQYRGVELEKILSLVQSPSPPKLV
jgi:ferredoxin